MNETPRAVPQAAGERRQAARRLLRQPMVAAEAEPDMFTLIRRHASALDRWFTQRLGYRLHVGADTARLTKSGYLPANRPLRTTSDRAFNRLEYVTLALVLSATVAGPPVLSLRDLARKVREAAADAGVSLPGEPAERRALVTALRWMIQHGLAEELYERVDAYASDESADALVRVRPDRINLLVTPHLTPSATAGELLDRAERRDNRRAWMRARLVEDPVTYRHDLTDDEWAELRRRLGEEETYLDEMFGLELEARAEGVAALDPDGGLTDVPFPAGGTIAHAALLVAASLCDPTGASASERHANGDVVVSRADIVELVAALADRHQRRWDKTLVASSETLTRRVLALLAHVRLAELDDDTVTMRPAAARFAVETASGRDGVPGSEQGRLL